MSSKAIIVNPWHWLEDDGSFPEDTRLRGKVLRVAQFIEYGGTLKRSHGRQTLVPCRRRPQKTSCRGQMCVMKMSDDAILAFCPLCKEDEFLIYEWEDTPWARGQQPPIDPAKEIGVTPQGPPEPGPDRRDEQLGAVLEVVGSRLSVAQVRELVTTVDSPIEVIQAVVGSCIAQPTVGAMERLMPVLTQVWNETPRPELGGSSPRRAHQAPTARKIGRNAPCPCGSGRKYKRCCGAH